MREVEIKKVVLKIGKRELSFTVEEARKLFDVLGDLFKTKVIREEHHHYEYPYYRWWYVPCDTTTDYISVDADNTTTNVDFDHTSATLTCSL